MRDAPIPKAALCLGIAGLLPFLWGALTPWIGAMERATLASVGPRFAGPYVLLSYGTVILSFMSGALWGFAARSDAEGVVTFYALSTIPALWAFFFVGGGPVAASIYLIAGFLGLLGLDWLFWKHGLAPSWWMRLRLPLTAVVVLCLATVSI